MRGIGRLVVVVVVVGTVGTWKEREVEKSGKSVESAQSGQGNQAFPLSAGRGVRQGVTGRPSAVHEHTEMRQMRPVRSGVKAAVPNIIVVRKPENTEAGYTGVGRAGSCVSDAAEDVSDDPVLVSLRQTLQHFELVPRLLKPVAYKPEGAVLAVECYYVISEFEFSIHQVEMQFFSASKGFCLSNCC
ncbi:hypothetical protein C8R43DRAFT_946863 [Mycena crocata]|nr:hypothetical protein C8R43DRAFT_946863 [Mycena crocata]